MPGKKNVSRNTPGGVNLHKASSEGKHGLDLTPQLAEMEPTPLRSVTHTSQHRHLPRTSPRRLGAMQPTKPLSMRLKHSQCDAQSYAGIKALIKSTSNSDVYHSHPKDFLKGACRTV